MFIVNPANATSPAPRPALLQALGPTGRSHAAALLSACPAHWPTPMHPMDGLASALGIGSLHVKDEGQRLGLRSFKALGGAYAVMRNVVARAASELAREVAAHELRSDSVRAVARTITVACATDGNHGRSVAAGARIAGCRAVVFVHAGVSAARCDAIAAQGAEIVRTAGSYDDSVAQAARQSMQNGWTVVSDTSWQGYEDIPLMVMQGYTIMAGEAFDALPEPPTHIFLQAGVGGMAAAVAAHALAVYGAASPKIIVVEPERAACLFASAKAGRATAVPQGEPTIMGMLECYEPSRIAWEILAPLATGFVTLSERSAVDAMRALAHPPPGDPAIVAGESGGAGLAGLTACLGDPAASTALGLGPQSRVLLFNSEGATDPVLYAHHVGATPEEICP